MPTTAHLEKHFTSTAAVRDIVIGMADGLTVPFALAAGLTGLAMASTSIVVTAGLAEIVAGSIAMGLGGYLAAKTDSEHYASERRREIEETVEIPDQEQEEVAKVFRGYGLADEHVQPVVNAICSDQKRWVDFMMRFELGLEEPEASRAGRSAVTIAASYIVGGLIPLTPYMLVGQIFTALSVSVGVTLFALLIFGFIKARFTDVAPWRGALQTALVGGLAAAAAFFLAHLVNLR
ncbi:MAG TPA: VIT1/CCC1 transporter family protein [Candidatus Dormibacteraeota bacterium]|nr:VIT1/CCC1 transporter family protein [Candidatus Dormibacteraeota bacterium]